MKAIDFALACLLSLAGIQGCTGKEDGTSGDQRDSGGGGSREEKLIEKTLNDLVSAYTKFPQSKDAQSILRFYAPDYSGVTNGKPDSLNDTAKALAEFTDRINLGEPLGISAKVANIRTNVTGTSGWAVFDYEYKVGSGGVVLQSDNGKCTTIHKMQGDSWLIQHAHCSKEAPQIFLR